jgi:hypothetical protein
MIGKTKLKENCIKTFIEKKKSSGTAENKIESNFKKLEDFFLLKDRDVNNLYKKSTIGFYGSTELCFLFKLFKDINLKSYWSFADLGSGDGRVVFLASLFTSTIAIEKDKELLKLSQRRKEELSGIILNPVEFKNADFYKIPLDEFGLVFINPDRPFYNDEFEEMLFKSKTDYLIDITLFKPRFLKKIKDFSIGIRKYALYSTK